ncbi:MAG TPA: translation initiation factor IF-2 [Thermopetrobacter sp.]|nr:translation initiation factor IF-2 [Thermopetrobacter sp.]
MSESDKKGDKPTLRLSRTTTETGRVRQNIAHGRSKTVVVETRRKRVITPPGKGKSATPAAAPDAPPAERPAAPTPPAQEDKAATPKAWEKLTPQERAAREKALELAKVRAVEEEKRKKEEARRRAEEEARRKREEEEKARQLAEEAARREAAAVAAKKAEESGAKPKPKPAAAAPTKEKRPETEQRRKPKPARGGDQRRRGKLTIARALSGDTEEDRARSLAAFRRRMERQKKQAAGATGQREKIAREVVIPEAITIQELANRMAERAVDVIKYLMQQGQMHKINDVIDADTAELIAEEFGHKVKRVSEADVEEGLIGPEDAPETLQPRPPVVTVMGHVDHGKTSLLDAIRKTRVTDHEAGGITQHIGAYQVETDGGKITFLDTPGHEAFTAMRARGAQATDIVVLVVAADDSVMPQTVEAINHARAAEVPIIVAINKIDKPDANPDKVRTELMQHEVFVESMGGDVLDVEVSALTGRGLSELLEAIQLQAELMELKANPDRPAEGLVIEARLDRGRGPVATVLVRRGTLAVGNIVVAGTGWGRVRALIDDTGRNVVRAGPSMPVEILGFNSVPEAGDVLVVVETEARAREVTEYRARKKREAKGVAMRRASLEQMMSQMKEGELKKFPVLVKADVQGSAEAIVQALQKLGNEEVQAQVVHYGVGGISESDVQLAATTGAAILGFNVRANRQASDAAQREGIEIRYYNIIYDLVDDMKQAMSGLLTPEKRETFIGNAEVLEVFNVSKVGKVAGCRVTEGQVERGAGVRLIRDDVVIHEGSLVSLKRFKDEVNSVTAGQECGMAFDNWQDIKPGDIVECYRVEEVARSL